MKKFFSKTLQNQFIFYISIAIIIPTIITSILGYSIIYRQIINRAEAKCISDLNSAREIYRNNITLIESVARITASRSFIINALQSKDRDTLQKELYNTLLNEKLDILTITDQNGIVIARGRNAASFGDTINTDKLVKEVLLTKSSVKGTDIMKSAELSKESSELVEKSKILFNNTPNAEPKNGTSEISAMLIKAAVPLYNADKKFIGVLVGGQLLNRNNTIIDKIKDVVHEGEVYNDKEIGTATIFMNDVRIATNVKNADGSYAFFTIVSDEVKEAVLKNGRKYTGEAFVVNDWYLTAYEPIIDVEGKIIGMLYVGLLKEPFSDILLQSVLFYFGITLAVLIIVYILTFYISRKISEPLKKLQNIAHRITNGDFKADFNIKGTREVEDLAASLNVMSKEIEAEKTELEQWGKTLEEKVNERTNELKRVNSQLFRSEKLASLGKLAAGVAHEINNPLTGVLTNSSLLLEDIPEEDSKHEDVQVIVNETIRCREIVKRLLDFARQTQPLKKITDVNLLLDNIILLVRNQASFRKITILKFFDENLPIIMADNDQIQQVFINLILNASDAMADGGTLSIFTKLSKDKEWIEIILKDTGCGISEENRDKIFDPFFTTKETGTGLGLSITYGIVEQHGGMIIMDSEINKGTTFTIKLPVNTPD